MSKTSVRIGAFEIDDAELHGEQQGERTLSIPCKSDPDLCMQLDAWDADTEYEGWQWWLGRSGGAWELVTCGYG